MSIETLNSYRFDKSSYFVFKVKRNFVKKFVLKTVGSIMDNKILFRFAGQPK